MGLTVDFSMGFVCFDAASKVGVGRSFIISENKKKRDFMCETLQTAVLYTVW